MGQLSDQERSGGWLKVNHPEISSRFSDLEIAAGVPYDSARYKIKEGDFPAIEALYEEYEAIDFKSDSDNDGEQQKSVLKKISDLLIAISKRD